MTPTNKRTSTCKSASENADAQRVFADYKEKQPVFFFSWNPENAFEPKRDDVFIVTFPKAGTTLLQQLIYQLKVVTGAVPSDPTGTDFEDISQVIPYLDAAHVTKRTSSVHPFTPRIWKSHALAEDVSYFRHVGRYIISIRDGISVAPSFLDFTWEWAVGYTINDETLRRAVFLSYFMERFLGLSPSSASATGYERDGNSLGIYHRWMKGWIEAKTLLQDRALYLVYEDVIKDLDATIRRVAHFLDIKVTEEQIAEVRSRCDRKRMAQDTRFCDVLVARGLGRAELGGRRVRLLDEPSFKSIELPSEAVDMCKEMLLDATGVEDYSALVHMVRGWNLTFL